MLPTGHDLKFLSDEELETFEENSSLWDTKEGDFGFFVLYDWSFDPETHRKFSDFPPLPYRTQVEWDQLSDFSKHLHIKLGRVSKQNAKYWKSSPKLIADFSTRVSV